MASKGAHLSKFPACVLLVDDDQGVRDSLSLAFSARKILCQSFESAEEFLALDPIPRPSCLVLDLRMPGMGGERLLARLQESGNHPPIIVLTAHGTVDSAVRSLKGGAVEFFEKPCPIEALVSKVEECFEQDREHLLREASRDELREQIARLTPREIDVLHLVARGQSSAQIAEALGLQAKSIEIYRSHILSKLGIPNSLELVRRLLLDDPHTWGQ